MLATLSVSAQAPADVPTPKQVQMFAGFYHDAIEDFFEVLGTELLSMPLDQFEGLPQRVQRRVCPAIVDQAAYQSFTFKAFGVMHARQTILEFMNRAKKARGFLFKDRARRFKIIGEKAKYCLRSDIVHVGFATFTEGAYLDTRTEFTLRALYKSQVPFLQWVWSGVEPSEERDNLGSLIDSMEQKYLLEIASP